MEKPLKLLRVYVVRTLPALAPKENSARWSIGRSATRLGQQNVRRSELDTPSAALVMTPDQALVVPSNLNIVFSPGAKVADVTAGARPSSASVNVGVTVRVVHRLTTVS